jgi:hypothetical protein
MKRYVAHIRKYSILLITIVLVCGSLFAETISIVGDYTAPGDITGDLVINNGSINITSAGDLIVRGDLKVTGGYIFMGPSAGKLRVFGNLIVTNTLQNGSASIHVHENIDVSGAIIVKSEFGDANITTTGATGSAGDIYAESIITCGYDEANVYAGRALNVAGKVDVTSTTSDAFVESNRLTIDVGSIATHAYGKAYVKAPFANGSVTVYGKIETESTNGVAYISGGQFVRSYEDVYTKGSGDSYVTADTDYINVMGIISTI